ncbi:type IV secretory system conjugative DNA transfer family protein [Paenibacillus enshidis]|uniref:Type IV secretory system conjugative DNA transfer family protein n=1 Tax=Paenibacillus enshidis TaxID=1458439 RepID=A0ABV5AVC3_9BACL
MNFISMIIGGFFSALGHVLAFVLKHIYMTAKQFSRNKKNASKIWNMKAIFWLLVTIIMFLLIVARYQDAIFAGRGPALYLSIPGLFLFLSGHTIYSSPFLRDVTGIKVLVKTLQFSLAVLAGGQILLRFIPLAAVLPITAITLAATIAFVLKKSVLAPKDDSVFSQLTSVVEQTEENLGDNLAKRVKALSTIFRREKGASLPISSFEASSFEGIDLSQKGCLSHLRYNDPSAKLDLFYTVPTEDEEARLISISLYDRVQHSQNLGGTGAGKTMLATTKLVQDILNDAVGVTLLEPKGSYISRMSNFIERVGREYYRLDPTLETSDCLNPLYVPEGEDIEQMIEANIAAFHAWLGPDARQFFKGRSTGLIRTSIKALKLGYGNKCGFNDLFDIINPDGHDKRAELLYLLKDKRNLVPSLVSYHNNLSGQQKLMEYTIQTYSSAYDYMLELTSNKYIQRMFCRESTFTIDEVMNQGKLLLINAAYGKLQSLTYTVGKLVLSLMRAETMRRNTSSKLIPHPVYVDEVEMFADNELSVFFEMAREFDVPVEVIHQGNEQLKDESKRLAAMVKQNAAQKYILAGTEVEDANYYSELFLEEYVPTISSGTDEMSTTGYNTQIREEKRRKVDTSDILSLKGYNYATGEPAECYFRGVINNVRMDAVKCHIYPVPSVLFSPLGDSEQANSEQVDLAKDREEQMGGEPEVVSEDSKTIPQEATKPIPESTKIIANKKPERIRNAIWDDEGEKREEQGKEEEGGGETAVDNTKPLQTAYVDNKMMSVAQKIKANAISIREEQKEKDEA